MKLLFCLILSPALLSAQSWVPFTAHYTETSTVHDASGKVLQQDTKELYEVRGADGSLATFVQVNGRNVSGNIWEGCGDVVRLNYTRHSATISHRQARKHFQVPTRDKPIGTATIAGLNVTGWPVHFSNGTGAMWFDMTNGVMAKSEAHLRGSNAVTTDYVKELQSIDLTSAAVDPPETKLPANFTLDTQAGSSPSCGNIEPAQP